MTYFFSCIIFFVFITDTPKHLVICCDVLEESHIYDKRGELIFTQVIFWKEHPAVGLNRTRFYPYGFRMLDGYKSIEKRDGGYRYFADNEEYQKGRIEVRAPIYRESWSQSDPEAASRKILWPEGVCPDLIRDVIKAGLPKIEEIIPESFAQGLLTPPK